MPQHGGKSLDIHAVFQRQGCECMPLRYNYDKPEKPRISRIFGYREVLYLTYFEDMSYAQAAEVTGKTVKQITNMVYRGKESLRRLLEREGVTNADI